jgi:hypothetical protein
LGWILYIIFFSCKPQRYLNNHSLLRILLQNGNWITFIMPLHFLWASSKGIFLAPGGIIKWEIWSCYWKMLKDDS